MVRSSLDHYRCELYRHRKRITMKPIIISLGGSLIAPGEIDLGFLRTFRNFLLQQIKKKRKIIVICGGGSTARKYIAAAKDLAHPSSVEADHIGVKATEINAELLRVILGSHAYSTVHSDYRKKVTFLHILVSAGFLTGTTSDYDAVMFAKQYHADTIYNLTNIDYVYTQDPHQYKKAKPIKELSWKSYFIQFGTRFKPGMHIPFDPIASRAAMKNKQKVYILNGKDLKNLERCIEGKPFKGTALS